METIVTIIDDVRAPELVNGKLYRVRKGKSLLYWNSSDSGTIAANAPEGTILMFLEGGVESPEFLLGEDIVWLSGIHLFDLERAS